MRLYFSFRGGDRPKNAEKEFPGVCVTPKAAYEPWMLFRKPISEKTVADNLRRWKTGGLRRLSIDTPLPDIIPSVRTLDREGVHFEPPVPQTAAMDAYHRPRSAAYGRGHGSRPVHGFRGDCRCGGSGRL